MIAHHLISSKYPSLDSISPSQFRTIYDHGGPELYIVTVELGYGQSQLALFNGRTLRQVQSQPKLGAGNVVIGWYRWWENWIQIGKLRSAQRRRMGIRSRNAGTGPRTERVGGR